MVDIVCLFGEPYISVKDSQSDFKFAGLTFFGGKHGTDKPTISFINYSRNVFCVGKADAHGHGAGGRAVKPFLLSILGQAPTSKKADVARDELGNVPYLLVYECLQFVAALSFCQSDKSATDPKIARFQTITSTCHGWLCHLE